MCHSCTNLVHGIVLQEQWIWPIRDILFHRLTRKVSKRSILHLGYRLLEIQIQILDNKMFKRSENKIPILLILYFQEPFCAIMNMTDKHWSCQPRPSLYGNIEANISLFCAEHLCFLLRLSSLESQVSSAQNLLRLFWIPLWEQNALIRMWGTCATVCICNDTVIISYIF